MNKICEKKENKIKFMFLRPENLSCQGMSEREKEKISNETHLALDKNYSHLRKITFIP
jgi:hypothetical protein